MSNRLKFYLLACIAFSPVVAVLIVMHNDGTLLPALKFAGGVAATALIASYYVKAIVGTGKAYDAWQADKKKPSAQQHPLQVIHDTFHNLASPQFAIGAWLRMAKDDSAWQVQDCKNLNGTFEYYIVPQGEVSLKPMQQMQAIKLMQSEIPKVFKSVEKVL